MQIKRATTLALIALSFICLIVISAHGQTRARSRRQTLTPKKQPSIEADPSLFTPDARPIDPTCLLTLDQAPTVRGFHLGMSLDEVLQHFNEQTRRALLSVIAAKRARADWYGRFAFDVDIVSAESGWASYVNNPVDYKGINGFIMVFLDDRLIEVSFRYTQEVKWQNISQFIDVISPALNFNQSWSISGDRTASLYCSGFKIEVGFGSDSASLVYPKPGDAYFTSPRITLTDVAEMEAAANRREEAAKKKQDADRRREEENRRIFRP